MNNAVTYSSHSYSLYPCPTSFSPLCLPHFSYPTFLEVPETQERTLGSEILIKIWLSAMGYDSSGRGCYRESCGLGGGSAEALSQTVSLMWYDFAHLRGWCEVTRLDPTGKGWWRVQLLGQASWGESTLVPESPAEADPLLRSYIDQWPLKWGHEATLTDPYYAVSFHIQFIHFFDQSRVW